MEIHNRVVFVTGGAHGIGRALCHAVHLAGGKVAVADIDLEGAEAVAREVDGLAIGLDVSDEKAINEAITRVENHMGLVDIFVSNAGVAFGDGPEGAAQLPFFAAAPGCYVEPVAFARQYAKGLEAILANEELTDEVILRMSQDYVREVVAHEVGHVLGLRHNFAGSLAATLSHTEMEDYIKAYIAGDDLSSYQDRVPGAPLNGPTTLLVIQPP